MSVLLLTSRDPLTSGDGPHPLRTAVELAAAGEQVTLVLMEDAVTVTRLGHRDVEHLVGVLDAGIEVLADGQACQRRRVDPIDGVKLSEPGEIVDRMVVTRAVWL